MVSPHLLAQYNGTTQNVGNTSGNASIAIGSNTGTGKANAAAGGTALGSAANASGANAVALGSSAFSVVGAVALGSSASAQVQDSIAIGRGAQVLTSSGGATGGVAIGQGAVSYDDGVAIGVGTMSDPTATAAGSGGTVIGYQASAGVNKGNHQTVIGGLAQGFADDVTAIGYTAQAFAARSVAIGVNAETNKISTDAAALVTTPMHSVPALRPSVVSL